MHWKMVRNNNEAWCRANGVSGSWRVAGGSEAVRALGRKLAEEVLEFLEDGDPAELFDVRDVLGELFTLTATESAERAHAEKVAVHGTFTAHIMWAPYPEETAPAGEEAHRGALKAAEFQPYNDISGQPSAFKGYSTQADL